MNEKPKNKIFPAALTAMPTAVIKIAFTVALTAIMLLQLCGCAVTPESTDAPQAFTELRDIPGITDEEIAAVEALRDKYDSFSYGSLHSTEAFYNTQGEIRGYAALFCEYLTELFGIQFIPELLEWGDMYPELKTDFSGDFIATEERRTELGYYFTDAIAERSFKYFRIAGSTPRSDIISSRPLRLGFLEGSTTAVAAIRALDETGVPFEPYYFTDNTTIYNELMSSGIDAFINEMVGEAAFLEIGNVVTEDFLPLIIEPVSFTAQNPELEPIINIVQKILAGGGTDFLVDLYEQGMGEYTWHKFYLQLDEREKEYLRENSAVAYLAEYDNYPVSFYNNNDKQWQGITIDILGEISALTGLSFEPVNEPGVSFSDLMTMLEFGEGAMISELIRNRERENRFLWPDNYIFTDDYVGVTLAATPETSVHRIRQLNVGVQTSTAYADLFYTWFPNHPKVIEYDDVSACLEGLEAGEIDIAMLCMRHLIMATNYNEQPHFKANIVFDYKFGSRFGFNKNEQVLCSIVDKAMSTINSEELAGAWMRKTFDYRATIVEAQRPWLIGAIVSLICLLILVIYLFSRRRHFARIKEESEFKSRFLATMSHEIRTPMNAILGIAQIHMQKPDLPEEFTDALETIYNSGNNLLSIINDILDMSKIETGKMELFPSVYDVANFINDAVQINIVRIESKPINFRLDVDDKLPAKLYGDNLRLKQILNNLLSNAIKYTSEGEVKLTVSAQPRAGDMPDDRITLVFEVSDTGVGMKPEDSSRLFSEEYLRFDSEATRNTEGTGLGLSITKRLVELMDGTISVQSEYGRGSVFTVTVVQRLLQDYDLNGAPTIGGEVAESLKNFTFSGKKHRDRRRRTRNPMPYGKVLIVDDVESNLLIAQGLLAQYKLQIDTASSGSEAIFKVSSGRTYDVIFMDHMMPEMDGIEATQRLRDMGYKGAIVALTANALVGNDEMFMQHGFDSFIAKPIDTRRLDATLNKYVRERHPEDAATAWMPPADDPVHAKLIAAVCRDIENAITVLRETTENGDTLLYTTTVHAVKSALANIGEQDASEAAFALEQAGHREDIDFIKENTESLLETLSALLEKYRN